MKRLVDKKHAGTPVREVVDLPWQRDFPGRMQPAVRPQEIISQT